jgi:hypothetical protein
MSMILLEPAYKISRMEIKRRTISVTPKSAAYCSANPPSGPETRGFPLLQISD